uniref:Uncharacterized protein n=1 Tax=Anguilla anguilla TaxID=7936 RepID=A0A0E9U352_ANGAN
MCVYIYTHIWCILGTCSGLHYYHISMISDRLHIGK